MAKVHESACAVAVKVAATPHGPGGACELVVVEDEAELKRELKRRGLDDRNVAVKVVVGKASRSVVFWFDASRPSSSAARLGATAAALRKDGERVEMNLAALSPALRARAVHAVAKAAYVFVPPAGGTNDATGPRVEVAGFGPGAVEVVRIAELAAWAADIENAPSNRVGPPELAELLRRGVARSEVLDERELARIGAGLLLGVGRGGEKAPRMVVLRSSSSGGKKKKMIALVGKGITFDAGGLALKPRSGMYGQHGDKSGAAVAAAVFRLLASDAAPVDLVAILPLAENLVSARSVRPGDVLTACDGTTVEVVDPDAEGRLVMADAIAYAAREFAPDAIVDFATLTRTAEMMHPDATAAVYAHDDAVAAAVAAAGEACGERVWRMPPWDEYDYETDSAVADARNAGWNTAADGYMAAMFLRRFVPPSCRDRWVHIDIAKNEASGVGPSSGSGPFVGSGVALGVGAVLYLASELTKKKAKG